MLALGLLGADPEADPGPAPPPASAPGAAALMERAERALGGERAQLEARLIVESDGSEERVVRFRAHYDRRRGRALVRVLAPEPDAGAVFLRLDPNLWVHVPQTGRTLLVPTRTLDEPWLGGDFTHADLVRAVDLLVDYEHRPLHLAPRAGQAPAAPAWVVVSLAREPDRVAWPRIVTWIEAERGAPLRREYYGPDGQLARVLELSEVRPVEGRPVPHRWTLRPAQRDDRVTRIELERIAFPERFDDVLFTTRQLRPPG